MASTDCCREGPGWSQQPSVGTVVLAFVNTLPPLGSIRISIKNAYQHFTEAPTLRQQLETAMQLLCRSLVFPDQPTLPLPLFGNGLSVCVS